jgi:hypothetical protein
LNNFKKIGIKVILVAIATCGVAFIIFVSVIGNMFGGDVSNALIKEIPSPDHYYKVVIFERSGGATTNITTHVSIISNDDVLANDAGNIFISDRHHDQAPAGSWGGPEIDIDWIDNYNISIKHHKNINIRKALDAFRGINIKYINHN